MTQLSGFPRSRVAFPCSPCGVLDRPERLQYNSVQCYNPSPLLLDGHLSGVTLDLLENNEMRPNSHKDKEPSDWNRCLLQLRL